MTKQEKVWQALLNNYLNWEEFYNICKLTTLGKDFFNNDVQAIPDKFSRKIYTTENDEKSAIVERWNRTMKEKLFKHFSASNST